MSEPSTLPQAYFDDLYARDEDPWRLGSSAYERDKYADTIAALDGRRFANAVEVGCSIGELTARLAPACDALLGVDIAEQPLAAARRRNAATPQVRFARMTLPHERPAGRFDLIVLSEVLYYFSRADLVKLAAWVGGALSGDGVLLLVHWLGETPDYPLDGQTAVAVFMDALGPALTTDLQRWRAHYRLDRMTRVAATA